MFRPTCVPSRKFADKYASWLNQVERFFALMTQRAIRGGSFDSTADLVKKIDHFIRTWSTVHAYDFCFGAEGKRGGSAAMRWGKLGTRARRMVN